MSFLEALKEVSKGKVIVSCTGAKYTKNKLKPKRLSDTAYVCKSLVSEKERKGTWSILGES